MRRERDDPDAGSPGDLPDDPVADVPADIRYDPDLAVHEPATVPADTAPPSRRSRSLVLFPLGIVALAVTVYVLFGLIAHEGKTASDYLDDIRLRGADAWEPAFQLSRRLADDPAAARDARFVPALIAAFETARGDDPRVRRYLALSLGETHDPRAVEPLLAALGDADAQTAIYAAWGLGTLGDARAVPPLRAALEHEDAGLRKMAAYALGALGARDAASALRGLLNDPVEDVAWNAALSLARLGDPAGAPLLGRMLDRTYLEAVRRPDEAGRPQPIAEPQKEDAIRSALDGLVLLHDRSHLDAVRALRDRDPSLGVRQAALRAAAALEGPGR